MVLVQNKKLVSGAVMRYYNSIVLDERARLAELQDLLLQRAFERQEAIGRGHEKRAKALEDEITELKQEKQNIRKWITVGST